jgi:biotin carboxyl carrier protein
MHYSVKIGDQTYSVEIDNLDTRPVVVSVDGEKMEVWPEEKSTPVTIVKREDENKSVPGEKPCPPDPPAQQAVTSKCVLAPIPGVIVELKAAVGQNVNRGDELCVLEAMKMKNSIRAGRNGTLGSIKIAVGDQVRHGQVLMEFTD